MLASQAIMRKHLREQMQASEKEKEKEKENADKRSLYDDKTSPSKDTNATEGTLETDEENIEGAEEQKNAAVPDYLICQPLKDFEETQEGTFVVVNKKFGQQCVYRFHGSKSLFLFGPRSRFRQFVISIITNQYFELFVLFTIITNCVFLALSNAPEEAEYVFAVIYTSEMLLKIAARGFIAHKFSYLRNAWNWLDFVVVILGYVTFMPGVANLSGVRTVRVLRALRTISAVKGLKAMVNTLLKSIKMLSDVLILSTFFLCVFALIGLQLFVGKLHNKCMVTYDPNKTNVTEHDFYHNKDNWFKRKNDQWFVCGESQTSAHCPENYTCVHDIGENPLWDFISFDNFIIALLSSLQMVTLDYWESIYNNVIAVTGQAYVIYFIFVVLLGPFYLINLVLAVVSLSYEQETAALQDKDVQEKIYLGIRRSASNFNFDGRDIPEPLYPDDVKAPEQPDKYSVSVNGSNPDLENEPQAPLADNEDDIIPPNDEQISIGCIGHIRLFVKAIVFHSFFDIFITICILLNTLCLALEHHNMNEGFKDVLDNFNLVFTAVFAMEMFLKLIAFGIKLYLKNNWNVFDGSIVMMSFVDLIVANASTSTDSAGLSVLRTFRLLRVLKLAQSWKTMGDLLATIGKSVGAVGNITLILGIIVYMFAVIGMQLFGAEYQVFFGDELPRWNYNDFGHSFMMIFRILCGKWIEPCWDGMRVFGPSYIMFVLPCFVIGNWIILNLFLALLLSSFGGDSLGGEEEEKEEEEKKKKKKKKFNIKELFSRKKRSASKVCPSLSPSQESLNKEANEEEEKEKNTPNCIHMDELQIPNGMNNNTNGLKHRDNGHSPEITNGDVKPTGHTPLTTIEVEETDGDNSNLNPSSGSTIQQSNSGSLHKASSQDIRASNGSIVTNGAAPPFANGNSLATSPEVVVKTQPVSNGEATIPVTLPVNMNKGRRDTCVTLSSRGSAAVDERVVPDCCPGFCYPEGCACCTGYRNSGLRGCWHGLRYKMLCFIEHKYFESFILFLIAVSSLSLVFEDIHLKNNPTLTLILQYMNYFFAVTFTLEFLVKLFALGFVAYFTSFWNLLDVFIVIISLVTLFGDKQLNALRALRALRPLRALSRFEGLKIVVNSLVQGVPAISNVLLVCLVFWLIFSIMGYQLFGGKFYKCVDREGTIFNYEEVPDRETCDLRASEGAKWVNSKINFDSSLDGFLALFQVATLEGMFEVMQDSVDTVAIDKQPIREHSFAAYFYYVVFIIMGSFFILNLFIGVIIDNFNRLKQQYEDAGFLGVFLTPSQRNWINTLKKTYARRPGKKPKRPASAWRASIFDFIHRTEFEFFIMAIIMLNMATMMVQHHQQDEWVTEVLKIINYVFNGIYIIEAILRLVALRSDYFKQGWNVFDFTIVVFSIIGIIMSTLQLEMPFSPGLLRVVRVFRLGRLLRFFEGARGIRRLLFALIKSLPGLVNIGTLLFLVMFIYAIIGMSLFGSVKKTGGLDETVNFETFGGSMLLLFRIATAAGWNTILEPLMIGEPNCVKPIGDNPNGDCGVAWLAVTYLVTYIMLLFLIIVNMYIAVILESFNEAQSQEEIGITDDDIESYIMLWEQYDPNGTRYIPYRLLSDFLDELDVPLRIPKPNDTAFIELEIPIKSGNRIHCLDLLQSLVKRVIGSLEGIGEEDNALIMLKLEEKFKNAFPGRHKEETLYTIVQRYREETRAAIIIQKAYRLYQLKKTLKKPGSATRFHEYKQVNENKSSEQVWEEKQVVDGDLSNSNSHLPPLSDAEHLERVIGMLWYSQRNRLGDDNSSMQDTSTQT